MNAPGEQGVPFDLSGLLSDLIAGTTLAALAIPEVMGYTRIAGTPVVTGLYTLLVPAILFAVFGSSRRLVVGADSATAAIMASALAPLAVPASAQWMQYAAMLALGCAALLLIARIARLAFLADFLSRTVLAGFLTGVGLQVAVGELPGMFGLDSQGTNTIEKLLHALRHVQAAHPLDAGIAVAVLAFVLVTKRWFPRLPGSLIAVVIAIGASIAFGWPEQGLQVVGTVQGGLPAVSLPELHALLDHSSKLGPAVLSMSLVILAQSAATSRAYAWKHNEQFSENRDIVGLALANAGAAVTGAFVVNGSPTKTQMVDSAGGRSQVAHLTMAVITGVVLLFATGPIAALPRAALSAVVFMIGIDLLRIRELRSIHSERPSEFWVALATAICVVVAGVEQAIVLAMVLSLIDHVRRGYRPHNSVIVRGPDGHAQLKSVSEGGEYATGLLVYRFSHAMYYANAEVLAREVAALAGSAASNLRWFVIDLDAVDDIDFSAGATLLAIRSELARHAVRLKFLRASPLVHSQLQRYGVADGEIEGQLFFASIREMRHAFDDSTQSGKDPSRH